MLLRVFVPGEFVHHDLAGLVQGLKITEQQAQQLQLAEALMGKGEGMAQGKAGVDRAGRLDLLADAAREGHRDGGDAGRFDDALDQSHGLIAQASGRGEDDGIHPILIKLVRHLGCGGVHQGVDVGRQDVTHEAEVVAADCADLA